MHLQALVISILNIGKLYLSKQAYNLAKRLVYDMPFNNILFLLASNSKTMLSSLLWEQENAAITLVACLWILISLAP